jgi:hypothetical protein
MILLAIIEIKTRSVVLDKARLQQLLHDDIRGCLEYAASYEIERLDVEGVDGVTRESILQEMQGKEKP